MAGLAGDGEYNGVDNQPDNEKYDKNAYQSKNCSQYAPEAVHERN